jgi:folate-dependent phosphoribosylglycinamide formyltransferase PurN
MSSTGRILKTLLICQDGARISQEGISRWLGSFSQLTGVVVLRETRQRVWRRVRRELGRVGPLRFLDVLAFRVYYNCFLRAKDRAWEGQKLHELCNRYPSLTTTIPVLYSSSPNTSEVTKFIRERSPDIVIARCKTLLKECVFSIPSQGTFVFHPGICPEYRNAHGCFWAIANDDLSKVGMTLLRIDKGVDTGPIYGYYSYDYDEVNESHAIMQHRVVLENLDLLQEKLLEIYEGSTLPLDTSGRRSAVWGQPWLTKYLSWKRRARRRAHEGHYTPVP